MAASADATGKIERLRKPQAVLRMSTISVCSLDSPQKKDEQNARKVNGALRVAKPKLPTIMWDQRDNCKEKLKYCDAFVRPVASSCMVTDAQPSFATFITSILN